MQYLLTQAGDARLSKIEARLDALEKAHTDTTTRHDTISTVILMIVILISLLFLIMTAGPSHEDSPPRLDFKPIIKGFLRPVLLWLLDLPDEEKHVG